MARQQVKAHIRWMIRRDMDEVYEIERECFRFPWTSEDFTRCLRQKNCIGMVAEIGSSERVGAFMVYELFSKSIHVLNFAVHPQFWGLGVGRQMVAKLEGKLTQQRRTRITTEVRERNLDAQLFFQAMGFAAVEILRGYYDDSEEDAYQFEYRVRKEAASGVQ